MTESYHFYKGQQFVVDFYPHPSGGTYQCCDTRHFIRSRAKTKESAIKKAHKEWDEYHER